MSNQIGTNPRSNGSVVMSAALVAGAASGVASLLNEARKKRKPDSTADALRQAQSEVQLSASQVRESAARIADLAKDQAPKVKANVQKEASVRAAKVKDQIRHSLDEADAGVDQVREAVRRANETLAEAQSRGGKQTKKGKKQLAAKKKDLDSFSQSGRELGKRLQVHLPDAGGNLQEKVAPRLADMRQQAEHTIAGVIDSQRKAAPEIAANVQRSVAPVLKDLGKRASDTASQVATTGRERAPERKTYLDEHVLPRLDEVRQRAAVVAGDALESSGERADQARERLVPELKQSAEELSKRFAESLDQAEHSLSEFRGNASHAMETAGTQARVVGKNARTGSMNAGATVLWTGVAAGVVYAGLLNAEQRQWVKTKAQRAFAGAKNLYADIRGRDGEFETGAGDQQTA